MMQLGQWRLDSVNGGRFRLDAGVMYGIIPKSVWQKLTPPDEFNRIPFATRCLLARSDRQTVLIDTGYGNKMSPLERSVHAVEEIDPLVAALHDLGVAPTDIDMVVFTHLHWDHSGGSTQWGEDRRPRPTFPRAVHLVNRWEWEDATRGDPALGGSYAPENFSVLDSAGQLQLVDGETEVAPGLWTRPTGGHTRGHQALLFESAGQVALYPGDLCPVTTHMRRMWCAAYDLYPMETRRRKVELLGAAAEGGWWVLWDHDPQLAVSRVERHATREFVAVEGQATL